MFAVFQIVIELMEVKIHSLNILELNMLIICLLTINLKPNHKKNNTIISIKKIIIIFF